MTEIERIWYDITNISQATEVSDISWIPINKLNNYYILNDIKIIIKIICQEIIRNFIYSIALSYR